MKSSPAIALILSLGCAAPSVDQKPASVDFSQVRIKFQPPAPAYPPLAKTAGIQGNVVLRIVIDAEGIPIAAEAIDGPPELRPTAEAYALQWRFFPCLYKGEPQKARFNFTMPFQLKASAPAK